MKQVIQEFLDGKQVAIAGASSKDTNFGKSLMQEFVKLGYTVYPVNPRCTEIDGTPCLGSVKDLPAGVENLILVVPPSVTDEIVDQCVGTPVRRIWMHRSMGRGAVSEDAIRVCKENGIDVVYGFCPMMFYGKGMHKFHLWIRETFGKVPAEYRA
ncbi:MAG TPA: CoA-binding protein [Bacteroides sp.]|nr:CoA-binding protein [Bacteroides sp.]